MRYEKPEITAMGPAMKCVQGSEKPQPGVFDNLLGRGITADAYEADE